MMNPTKMVTHLYGEPEGVQTEIHPAIHDLGIKLVAD